MERENAIKMIDTLCEACGFYNYCPMEYMCPPKEFIINTIYKHTEDKE